MWECYHCGFQNVDTGPICVKCRAPKPAPGQKRKGRSYHSAEMAAQSRLADQVMSQSLPPVPTEKDLLEKWEELAKDPEKGYAEMVLLENRQYALREAIKQLAGIVKNPQARGVEERLSNMVQLLINWDKQL